MLKISKKKPSKLKKNDENSLLILLYSAAADAVSPNALESK